jgi:hypothetical protein
MVDIDVSGVRRGTGGIRRVPSRAVLAELRPATRAWRRRRAASYNPIAAAK